MNSSEYTQLHAQCVSDLRRTLSSEEREQDELAALVALGAEGFKRGSDGAIAETIRHLLVHRGLIALHDGDIEKGWRLLSDALAYFNFSLRGEVLAVYRPENYVRSTILPDVFIAMMAIAMACRDIASARYAAQHLDKLFAKGVVAAYVPDDELRAFFDIITVALASGVWPNEAGSLSSKSVYARLFGQVGSDSLRETLDGCCNFHMQRVTNGTTARQGTEDNMFVSVLWAAAPFELLFWRGLYEMYWGELSIDVAHPLWSSPLIQTRPTSEIRRPAVFDRLDEMATHVWGKMWLATGPEEATS